MLDNSRKYELVVRPLGRSPANEYPLNGVVWIEGRDGNRYTIDISNHSLGRALFIISVDGLDVIEGKSAGLDSPGYIVNGNSSISVPGWKLNNAEAAEFYFSRGQDSYVNTIGGNTANTGVIGAMVFSEYCPPIYQNVSIYNHCGPGTFGPGPFGSGSGGWASSAGILRNATLDSLSVTAGANSICTNTVNQEVGTGFGDATEWKTTEANFTKADPNNPDTILAIYYNTARNLEKMGIRLRKRNNPGYTADPFPRYTSSVGTGCKTPPGWRGRS